MHEAKLYEHAPYWSKTTENLLRGGEISHGMVLARVMELCKEQEGNCVWPDIPERCWTQAVAEIIGI